MYLKIRTRIHEIVDLCRFFPRKLSFNCKITREVRFSVHASAPCDRKFAAVIVSPPLSWGEGWGRGPSSINNNSSCCKQQLHSLITYSTTCYSKIQCSSTRISENTDTFKTLLKTCLFRLAFGELEWFGWCTIGHCRHNWRMKWRNVLFASENEIYRKLFSLWIILIGRYFQFWNYQNDKYKVIIRYHWRTWRLKFADSRVCLHFITKTAEGSSSN